MTCLGPTFWPQLSFLFSHVTRFPTTSYSSHRYLVCALTLLHLFRNRYSDRGFFVSGLKFLHLSATRYSVTEVPPLLWNFLTGRTSYSGHRFLAPAPMLRHPSHGADILVPGFTFLFSWCFTTRGPDMLVTGFSFCSHDASSLLEDPIRWSQFLFMWYLKRSFRPAASSQAGSM